MVLKQITAPLTEPVTIEEVCGQIRIGDLSEEVATVNLFIAAIREQAEAMTRRALITQEWELVLDGFPGGRIPITLPKAPVQSITSIKYIDVNGVEQTLDSIAYRLLADCEPSDVIPAYGISWPATRCDKAVVRVRFKCGYGPLASDDPEDPDKVMPNNVPNGIKQWMLLNIGSLYSNRESVIVEGRLNLIELTTLADGLIANYRLPRL